MSGLTHVHYDENEDSAGWRMLACWESELVDIHWRVVQVPGGLGPAAEKENVRLAVSWVVK